MNALFDLRDAGQSIWYGSATRADTAVSAVRESPHHLPGR